MQNLLIQTLGEALRLNKDSSAESDKLRAYLEHLYVAEVKGTSEEFWLKDSQEQTEKEKVLSSLVYTLGFDQPKVVTGSNQNLICPFIDYQIMR